MTPCGWRPLATTTGLDLVRQAAALAVSEAAQLMAIENRRFLRRVVRYLVAEAGIAQFLDIGAGPPTQGNVRQVAGH